MIWNQHRLTHILSAKPRPKTRFLKNLHFQTYSKTGRFFGPKSVGFGNTCTQTLMQFQSTCYLIFYRNFIPAYKNLHIMTHKTFINRYQVLGQRKFRIEVCFNFLIGLSAGSSTISVALSGITGFSGVSSGTSYSSRAISSSS